jgi:CubicO group peptidase (beta-lactamase class C family)
MKAQRIAMARLLALTFFSLVSVPCGALAAEEEHQTNRLTIDRLMTTLSGRGQFNGSILVAVGGKTIYRNGFGDADSQSKRKFTPATISNIGSVSKQFTAMAVMMLAEQNKLSYEDPVSKYIRELGEFEGITLRQLLNHTSGIPDVGDLGIDHARLTNAEVLQRLSKPGFLVSRPGHKYRYSNANYVLLCVIVERVSRQSLGDFLAAKIFKPLEMNNTFLSVEPLEKAGSVAVAYDQFGKRDDAGGFITGSSGVYSTVDDLLKWDQALFTERLVRQSMLEAAFTPGRVREGTSTYGFGWNISNRDGGKFVWHTGNTGGFRAFVGRRLADKTTVILLTNRGNSKRQEINDAILNILDGKPYVLPKRSLAEAMYEKIGKEGMKAAIRMYDSLRTANDTTYDLSESELNALGYQLLYGDHKTSDAIEIFRLNAVAYAKSSNPFDSLAEAYQVSGNKELAIKNYEKAVELDPTNLHAVDMLKKLKLAR